MTEISRRSAIALGAAAGLATFAEGAFAADAPKSTKDMPMKHTELALSKEECLYIIEHTDHAVLSTADATGEPYGVPVTPFMLNGKIYFHGIGMGEGRRNANLTQNPRGSLCWIAKQDINEPHLTVDYVSVIARGPIRIVTDAKEKEKFMRYLLARFTPSIDIDKAMAARTQKIALYMNVFEMTLENITEKAKDRGYMHYFGKQRPGKKDSD